jgi:cold shock protein
MRGIVAWFNNGKGFGFISPTDEYGILMGEKKDCFVHHTGIDMDGFRTLQQGDRVEYEIGDKDGRPMAVNVRLIEKGVREV